MTMVATFNKTSSKQQEYNMLMQGSGNCIMAQ